MADQFGNFNIPPALQQLLGAIQPGAPPGTPGVDPGLDPGMENLIQKAGAATQMGTEAFGGREQRLQGLEQQLGAARQQQAGVGPMSYSPQFQPSNSTGNVLRNVLKGLATVGLSTRPGQAIESVLYSKPREQYGRLAQQIAGLQGQITGEGQALGAEAGMASRPIYGGARAGMVAPAEERSQAAMLSSQAKMADVQRLISSQNIMNQLHLSQADAAKAEAMLRRAMPDILRKGLVTREDLMNASIAEKIQAQAPMLDRIANWFNGQFGPTQVQAPGGSQPVQGRNPIPKRSGKGGGPSTPAGGQTKPAYQKNGKWYDATTNQEIK